MLFDRLQRHASRMFRLYRSAGSFRWLGAAGAFLFLIGPPALGDEKPLQNPPASNHWISIFDGRTLAGWKSTNFGGEGEVTVEKSSPGGEGCMAFDFGASMTGVTYTGKFPQTNYELRWKARKLEGVDFFSAATIPYGDSHCSFINGGWGGGVVGISSIDGDDASQNETTRYLRFDENRWYCFRVRVRPGRIEVWIDNKAVVNLAVQGRRISTRVEVDLSKPLGFSAWETRSELKDIAYRRLSR